MKNKINLFHTLNIIAIVIIISTKIVSAQIISADALKKDVYFLASDSLNGRQTGSKGEQIASDYIIKQYKLLGLKPMGDNGTFLQAFETNVGIKYSGENYLSVNRAMLQADSDYYALNFSASGKATGSLQNAGYGMNAPQIEVNDFEKASSDSGKIYLIETSSPDGESPHSKYYPYLDLQSKIQNAIKSGATAVLLINTHADAEDPSKNFTKYLTPVSIPVVFVKKTAYKKYFTGKKILIQLSVGLEKISITGHNVIAYKDNGAKTTVAIGAHYDHLGHNEFGGSLHKGEGNGIHNGADDNASGTAGVMALATVLSSQKNVNNNYLFINFSGEELGLIGSKYFAEHSTVDTNTLNYMINMDMIGRYNPEKGMEIGGLGTSPQYDFIRSMKDDSLKWKLGESGTGPTDFTSFYHINVPVLNFFTGVHEDYHKPTDDADKLNYKKEAEILELELRIIDSLNSKGTLTFARTKESESTGAPTYKVKLGIIPDYMYEGVGLRVDGVDDGLVASKAGIQKGDIIIKVGDFTISDIHIYMKALGSITKGDTVIIIVKRGDEEKKLSANF
ncbi:MAG: M28 family peptidase [Sphingobacteriales bacterium]|nr:MAG: M28 family peptidase [Sphingobacteriales bacterium]